MSDEKCPSADELLSFVDADLPPEQLSRIEKHLELCSACAKRAMTLTTLVTDVGAPLEGPTLDVPEHVASVMKRLDSRVKTERWSRVATWGSALSAAAVALLLFTKLREPSAPPRDGAGEFVARGGTTEASLSRNVGVQLYAQQPALVALGSGSRIGGGTALTAGLRNLGKERVYLLLFAVDSQKQLHWIAPEYTTPGENPVATAIAPSVTERLLPSASVFDDLAPGSLRVVAVLSHSPLHVLDVEGLPPAELSSEKLLERLPRAEVRQFLLEVETRAKP